MQRFYYIVFHFVELLIFELLEVQELLSVWKNRLT